MKRLPLILILLLPGCGTDGKSAVRGSVRLDGQPIKSGTIRFLSTELREGANIVDGQFKAHVPPGTYRIELNAQGPAGEETRPGFDGKDEVIQLTKELFPERFNEKSELTETIKAGDNTLTFDLKSK